MKRLFGKARSGGAVEDLQAQAADELERARVGAAATAPLSESPRPARRQRPSHPRSATLGARRRVPGGRPAGN